MNELAGRIKLVIDTLQIVDIKATKENLSHMLGCQQELERIMNALLGITQPFVPGNAVQAHETDTEPVDVEVTEVGRAD